MKQYDLFICVMSVCVRVCVHMHTHTQAFVRLFQLKMWSQCCYKSLTSLALDSIDF